MEGSRSDPPPDWNPPGAEPGLEGFVKCRGFELDLIFNAAIVESMWQLELGSRESYPERPREPDCTYYMRTGFCGYGLRCRFNHPQDRSTFYLAMLVISSCLGYKFDMDFAQFKLFDVAELLGKSWGTSVPNIAQVDGAVRLGSGEYPERMGQPVCQYYLRTGSCKFGAFCKYHHPRHGGGSMSSVSLNIYGYPLRLGEKECSYYMKTGQCKFGATCKFHHPQPVGTSVPAPAPAFYPTVQPPSAPSSQQYGGVSTSWQVARPQLLPGSYMQGAYGPVLLPPGVVPVPGWSPYSAPVSPTDSLGTRPTAGVGPLYGVAQLSPSARAYAGPYLSSISSAGPSSSSQKEHIFPERLGQPECQYYMRTGDCKFGSTCRYHHPPGWITPKTNCLLSSMGFPLRPRILISSKEAMYDDWFRTKSFHINVRCGDEYAKLVINDDSNVNFVSNVLIGKLNLKTQEHSQPTKSKLDDSKGHSLREPETGAPLCTFYAQHGVCKFGPTCKFDHPTGTLSYSPSASSLADMPVAPYRIGSSLATLAPSSSSSDLRSEFISGPNKDSFSIRMPSSENTSSGSVGSIFSQSGPVPRSNVQLSGQSSACLSSSSSTGQGDEVRSSN
ncbi:hypothetical protein HHK36_026551 [Tetracentron sinense]|uniref:C3H1-type domain-containing protein n=1 Tax=Tetracentron sinense TaxID=13715 RepID=A0A835D5K7_TETSI|nr:hypothetical protein HHK36_026551 [Tetracentron sinense]